MVNFCWSELGPYIRYLLYMGFFHLTSHNFCVHTSCHHVYECPTPSLLRLSFLAFLPHTRHHPEFRPHHEMSERTTTRIRVIAPKTRFGVAGLGREVPVNRRGYNINRQGNTGCSSSWTLIGLTMISTDPRSARLC